MITSISWGVLAAVLSLLAGTAITQAEPVKEGENCVVPLPQGVKLEMIWVKPGTFTMGSSEDELGRFKDEFQHEVTLTHGYWLGKYEVTQGQYEVVMGVNPSASKEDDLPVEKVSWFDAKEFCAKLTALEKAAGRLPEGYSYTLPTEAQWEYACRAGTTTALNSGKDLTYRDRCSNLNEVGWYDKNSDKKTHPVGQKQPNAWGLYDMHGNVWEWCLDRCDDNGKADTYTAGIKDPLSTQGSSRVFRGGSKIVVARECRSAGRNYYGPGSRYDDLGFRVALAFSAEPVQETKIREGENCQISLPQGAEIDMIWIEPGSFMMGSPSGELGRDDDETQHRVTLTKGYWLGKYEVTQAQWKAVMESNPSKFIGDDLPVEQVSWDDAMKFCKKLTERERDAERLPSGYEYTLPTEAQWEYACRAGTTSSLNSGKNVTTAEKKGICDNLDEVGWYWMNGGKKNWNEGKDPAICTHPGGEKKPNNWGLYDMHGNVCEWCLDWKGDYPTSSVTDPKGADTGKYRVFRGGSWGSNPRYCRSAFRNGNTPDYRNIDLGFRLALVPVQ
jgi:formylglycine-generating enzyme required for sulfatase activity